MIKIDADTTIFLDFDDTLFDYTKAVNHLLEEVEVYGITKDDWYSTYEKIKAEHGAYNREEHFKLMSEIASEDIDLKAIYRKYISKPGVYLFKDAIKFLEKYKGNPIYIISYGETEYQREKISGSGITKYAKDIIVTIGSKAGVINGISYKKGVFIDDRVVHALDVSSKCKNMDTLLIDRRGEHERGKVRVYSIINTLDDI